jgi:lipopolysaccharide transport system ATP-binding protein
VNAIEVCNVSKTFRIPHERHTTIAERLLGLFRANEIEVLQALQDVSLEVPAGSFVGVIGSNGSGKSTLLKIIAGLLVPDDGQVRINGTLVPLLELGLGFHQELTVRENVSLYGAVLGYSRQSMARRVEEVVSFAGLERFQDAKLKSLSSGMTMRLAFATALRADADTLLLDEVMAVGDAQFQRKCIEVFEGLKRQRKTILLVSHDLASVQRFCDRVFWLDKGRLVMAGECIEVVQTYLAVSQSSPDNLPALDSGEVSEHRWGDGRLRFTRIALTDDEGRPVTQVRPWTRLTVDVRMRARVASDAPVLGLILWLGGDLVYSINSRQLGFDMPDFAAGEEREVAMHFTAALGAGRYTITIAAANAREGAAYDWVNHASTFLVTGATGEGPADLGAEFTAIAIGSPSQSESRT